MTAFAELVLGGARSGKSRLAEQRALESNLECVYVATATAHDDEMESRIAHHKASRGAQWQLVEEPISLADRLLDEDSAERCILVDCLTLWLSNCLHANCWEYERSRLLEVFQSLQCHLILVSNETGLGVVPMGELTRRFVDEAGFLHQSLGELCDEVTLVVAGLPLTLKPAGVR